MWGKQAENLVKYQTKGSLIAVEGSNRVDKYQNEKGENRYKHYILVNTIEYLGTKKEESPVKIEKSPAESGNDPFAEFGNEVVITDDMLPF